MCTDQRYEISNEFNGVQFIKTTTIKRIQRKAYNPLTNQGTKYQIVVFHLNHLIMYTDQRYEISNEFNGVQFIKTTTIINFCFQFVFFLVTEECI